MRGDKSVCQNCAEVHADLSARRARYLASSNERKAQKEAGLLLLREQDENDVSGDRKGLKAAERRRRRRNVLRALAEPRNRREKVQEPIYTTTKPAKNPTAFDDNLPSVASRQPRDSTFVASKNRRRVRRGGGRPGDLGRPTRDPRRLHLHQSRRRRPRRSSGFLADPRRRRAALRAAPPASVFGTVQPEREDLAVGSGGVAAQSLDAAAQAQAPDVRICCTRGASLRDQTTVVAPEPPAAPSTLCCSLLDMAERVWGTGWSACTFVMLLPSS